MKLGSLFTGYGGLDQAVTAVTGAETVWVSDVDKGANKILAHRYPQVPNLGDITQVDFTAVEPVDILTGGFPCQDLSHAGKRAGLKEGTRSGLWSHMARAIKELNPRLVVVENVRGLLSADAPGDVEPCPWCVGNGSTVNLRALGVVLADLADLGFDAEWVGLRCADVGGCHGRFRVFLAAFPTNTGSEVRQFGTGLCESEQTRNGGGQSARDDRASDVTLLPTPMAAEGTKPSNTMGVARREETGQAFLTNVVVSLAGLDPSELLPTPRATDGTKGGPNQRGSSGDLMLPSAVLLPTPTGRDHKDTEGFTPHPEKRKLPHTIKGETFGNYAPAVARWEQATRPAPPPTELRPSGKGRLSPAFVEWMMGLPEGWVTDVPDLSWAEQLKALGNGVVPQQAAAALTHLLGRP